MKHVAALGKLRNLDLRQTRVTNAGLAKLADLRELRFVNVDGTQVTRDGLEQLRQAIPNLKTSPDYVGGQMADWEKLSDEVQEFVKGKRSGDAAKSPAR